MHPQTWEWMALAGLLTATLILDLVVSDRKPHAFTPRSAARWLGVYILLAAGFAGWVALQHGATYSGQFIATYLTEYSLSVDNLFVFLVLMTSFAVPEALRHRVLLVGVVLSLVLRLGLILVGAEAISRFAPTLFILAAFLAWTARNVWASHDSEPDPDGNALIRFAERTLPTTREYHGTRLIAKLDGKRHLTPLALVMAAVGTTDLLFAVDSVPAAFGLTREPFIVFAANAFALMGLRQMFFLLHGLLERLVYLARGLAVILGFIAGKLALEAVDATFPHLHPPHISTPLSLGIITGILAVTVALSLRAAKEHPELEEQALEHEAAELHHVEGAALSHLDAHAPAAGSPETGKPVRLARARAAYRSLPHPIRWGLVAAAGSALLLTGLACLVLPGPGIPLIIAGLAILGTEFAWAQVLLARVKKQTKQIVDKARSRKHP